LTADGSPQLKGVVWERAGDELRVIYDRRDQLLIPDPDGTVDTLLALLRDGGRTVVELAAAMSERGSPVAVQDVRDAVAALDEYGLVEDGNRLGRLPAAEAERHFSNLAFFESFASLARSREDFHVALREAHVLVLGTGGLNANVIPHLCGLGVGRLTLLDRDRVEPRNFARQYLYRWTQIGAPKVDRAAEWVRAFDPTIAVTAVHAGIDAPDDVGDLLDRYRPDVVAAGVDHPADVDRWVNAACVPRGIPFVRGGMWVTEGIVFSVDPGRSGCLECAENWSPEEPDPAAEQMRAGLRLYRTKPRTNRGIGPVAGLLGALVSFELLRYLTGFEPPVYAANELMIDFAAGCAMTRREWPRLPDCPACGREPVPAGAGRGDGTRRGGEPL
jgi:molybdopterin/thiamine biosynthesis adenylyltransferase